MRRSGGKAVLCRLPVLDSPQAPERTPTQTQRRAPPACPTESCTMQAGFGALLPKAATCNRTASRRRRLLAHRAAVNRATRLTQAPSPAIPIEHDFKSRHFHGQVRRFAHDKPDRLRALPCLLRGPALQRRRSGRKQLLPGVQVEHDVRVTRCCPTLRCHPRLAADLHAEPSVVLTPARRSSC